MNKYLKGYLVAAGLWLAVCWTIYGACAIAGSGSANARTAGGVSLLSWLVGFVGAAIQSDEWW